MNTQEQSAIDTINLLAAGRPLVYVVTQEEAECQAELAQLISKQNAWSLLIWNSAVGLQSLVGKHAIENVKIPDHITLLQWFYNTSVTDNTILVLHDFHGFLNTDRNASAVDHKTIRLTKQICMSGRENSKRIIIISPILQVPIEITEYAAVIDWALPTQEEIEREVKAIVDHNKHVITDIVEPEDISKASQIMRGMTLYQTNLAASESLVIHKSLNPYHLVETKKQAIRKNGILEWIDPANYPVQVGGLPNLKKWLAQRARAYEPQARERNIPYPKGVLLLGVQGCGKSAIIKSTGRDLNMPILRMDFGRVFDSLLGNTEARQRQALAIAEAVSPCILWLDELDKGLGGHEHDGGTAQRFFATQLTWMEECRHPVFVMATANNVKVLPPEILRKERFDEIFFIDLPSEEDRVEILRIYLDEYRVLLNSEEIEQIAEDMNGYSGAEIKSVTHEAAFIAYCEDEIPNINHIRDVMNNTHRLIDINQEAIEELRNWTKNRARRA